jgi:hypothetical protein
MQRMMQLRSTGLTWQIVGDEVVVLDLEGSTYLKLHGSGRALWEALTEPRTADDLVVLLVDRYSIDAGRAMGDVVSFLDDLRARRLLDESSSAA